MHKKNHKCITQISFSHETVASSVRKILQASRSVSQKWCNIPMHVYEILLNSTWNTRNVLKIAYMPRYRVLPVTGITLVHCTLNMAYLINAEIYQWYAMAVAVEPQTKMGFASQSSVVYKTEKKTEQTTISSCHHVRQFFPCGQAITPNCKFLPVKLKSWDVSRYTCASCAIHTLRLLCVTNTNEK